MSMCRCVGVVGARVCDCLSSHPISITLALASIHLYESSETDITPIGNNSKIKLVAVSVYTPHWSVRMKTQGVTVLYTLNECCDHAQYRHV